MCINTLPKGDSDDDDDDNNNKTKLALVTARRHILMKV
jgi:hypothetical protein